MSYLASRSRLTTHDLGRFPEQTLFHKVARTLCEAECLPRKELFESWEVARRARRRLRGRRVVDLACGHGLIGQLMLLLDPKLESALAIDVVVPQSAALVKEAMAKSWPQLRGRVTIEGRSIKEVELRDGDVLVSCHACGGLTDQVLERAIDNQLPVAVLPCCQSYTHGDKGGLDGWLDPALAIDVTRAARLRAHGYTVFTQQIPQALTEKNRLLLGTLSTSATD